jgi:bifunctional non-homologous end joining protein LigD
MLPRTRGRASDRRPAARPGPRPVRDDERLARPARRIYVDTTRNAYAQPAVATPLRWEELDDRALKPNGWTIRTIGGRLGADGDPWHGIGRHARSLAKPAARLAA